MTTPTPDQLTEPCEFVPPNEPWSCRTHPGGLRTSLDEEQCDVARPAEPFNDAYLDNIRTSVAEGKKLPNHYIIRRLLATLDAALADRPDPGELDAAWAEAEAALPEGWHIELRRYDDGTITAEAWPRRADLRGQDVNVEGDTPAAALRALADALRERAAG